MARCCGAGTGCNCRVTAGDNVTVTGTGSFDDPFVVNASGDFATNSLEIGEVVTSSPGADADATITGTPPNQILNLVLPRGTQGPAGPEGDPGVAATIAVGSTTTVAPTEPATVINSGSSAAAVLDFEIPKGDPGDPGTDGIDGVSATIAIGSTTTVGPSEPATVTNSGTSSAAVFDFEIPKGDKGDTGDPGFTGVYGAAGTVPGPYPDGTVTFEY